jgi:hypothetical protein
MTTCSFLKSFCWAAAVIALGGLRCGGGTDPGRAILPAKAEATSVDLPVMQRVYAEVKTPFKCGVILKGEGGRSLDCPSVFRHGGRWCMVYISFDGSGYDTHLAASDDLMSWKPLGTILARGSGGWDSEQLAGVIALQDCVWGGSYELQTFGGRFWLS